MDKYDLDYFHGKNSTYINDFTWENECDRCREMAEKVNDMLHPTSILEIGCAYGFQLRAFTELDIQSFGCDISEIATSPGMKICDAREKLPYMDNEFDVVFTDSTLEHIETDYITSIMKEVYRVARRAFYLKVPVGLTTENKPWGDKTHKTYLSPSYWISEAFKAGWLVDLRLSKHLSEPPFQDGRMVFFKSLKEI